MGLLSIRTGHEGWLVARGWLRTDKSTAHDDDAECFVKRSTNIAAGSTGWVLDSHVHRAHIETLECCSL